MSADVSTYDVRKRVCNTHVSGRDHSQTITKGTV